MSDQIRRHAVDCGFAYDGRCTCHITAPRGRTNDYIRGVLFSDFASIEARVSAASRAAVEQRLAGLSDEKLGQLVEQVGSEIRRRCPQWQLVGESIIQHGRALFGDRREQQAGTATEQHEREQRQRVSSDRCNLCNGTGCVHCER
jgi:hypothetical protein